MPRPTTLPGVRRTGLRAALACLLGAALTLAGCAANRPAIAPVAPAANATSPKTALWVGNSFFYYNNGMSGHVSQLLAASLPGGTAGYRSTSVTISSPDPGGA